MRYVGKYPTDAKIFIDYGRKKVSVGYPIKQTKFRHIYHACLLFWVCFIQWLLFSIIILVIIVGLFVVPKILFGGVVFEYEFISYSINSGQIWVMFLVLVVVCFIILFPPLILTGIYYMSPKFQKKLPEWNSKMVRFLKNPYEIKYKTIKTKEVLVPCFTNNMIEYSTKKDFSKYLESIKIEPIKAHKRKLFNKKKKRLQTMNWFALFTFSKIPKEGSLLVKFI